MPPNDVDAEKEAGECSLQVIHGIQSAVAWTYCLLCFQL